MVRSQVAVLHRDVIRINVFLDVMTDDGLVYYIAPAPADTMHSFQGSGLPFANAEQAFDNPTMGVVSQNSDGNCVIECRLPNSYYIEVGNKLIRPHMNLSYYSGGEKVNATIDLNLYVPYRSLYPPFKENDPMNYAGQFDIPIMTQEKLFRSYAYPESPMPTDAQETYWGLKPPNA